jgi:hypothetical protein
MMISNIFIRPILLFFFLSLFGSVKAQMSGVYNIPGSYPTIAIAVTNLNNLGISGAVTINIAAGYTEMAPLGGFQLYVSGTSVNPIIIQKNGVGNNPVITSYTTGVGTPATMTQDGIWRMMGCDYVTIDGIDLVDQNTNNPATMEFGFGFFNSPSGCQNNTIKNCHIKLNTINNVLGSGMAGHGSRGIEVTNALYNSHLWNSNPSNFSETHSYNKFYNNIIENCNVGISLKGAWTNTISTACQFNDIGGISAVTGNTIINFGGVANATNLATGIASENHWESNISNNIINNNNGFWTNHPAVLRGIYSNTSNNANISINSNTVSLKTNGIFFTTAIENSTNSNFNGTGTANMNGNSIINCSQSNPGSNFFNGIVNGSLINNLNINNNIFNNITMSSNYSIGNAAIVNTGFIGNSANINNNSISNINITASLTSSDFRGISNQTGTFTALSISGNSISAIAYSGISSGEFHFIYSNSSPSVSVFSNNNCSNITVHTSSLTNCMYINGSSSTVTIDGNIISNVSKAIAGNYLYGIYALSPNAPGLITVSNNTISGAHTKNNTIFNAIQVSNGNANTTNSRKYIIKSNIVNNITGDTMSTSYGINGGLCGLGSSIHNNHIFNFIGCLAHGIALPFNGTNLAIHSNTIHAFKQTNQAQGIIIQYAKDVNVYKNRVFDLEAGNNGFACGLSVVSSTGTTYVSNNLISDLRTPNSSGGQVCGINVGTAFFGTSSLTTCFNTIYLNAISTSTNFSACGLKYGSNNLPTPSLLKLYNNIIVNNSTVVGPFQKNTAFEDTTPFSPANSGVSSNNNLLYAGATSTNNQIIKGFATLAAAKNALWPRESASAEEFPTFANLNGLHPAFLKLSNSVPTQAESAGVNILGVTDDHGGTIRNTQTPDIGAWEGIYPLADSIAPLISNIKITSGSCNLSSITLTANIQDASGVASATFSPRCYYKINSGPYISNSGTLTSGSNFNGNWQFSISYSANPGDLLSYYFAAQDISLLQNVGASPSVSFTASNVNSVITTPASEYTLIIIGVLNGTYLVGASGNFTTLTSAAKAYNTWCITGPVTYVLTDVNYSTNETFPITFLKNPDASNTNSLIIKPNTSINTTITTSGDTCIFKIKDANYINIDGLNTSGSSLSLINNYPNFSAGIWLANNSTTNVGCKKIGIKNTHIIAGSNSVPNHYGVVSGTSSNLFSGTVLQDSIVIQNNFIERTYESGIKAVGFPLKDWLVSGNIIGPAANGPNSLNGHGIFLVGTSSGTVSGNIVRNISTSMQNIYGLYFGSCANLSIINNTVISISSSAMSSGVQSIAGIKIGGTNNNILIEKNNISGISNNSSFASIGARGITIDGGGVGNKIKNNFISNIFSGGGLGGQLMPIGMAIENCFGYDIDNNTINLASSYFGYVGSMGSSAVYINSAATNIRFRNNILSNTYDNTNSSFDIAYSIYSDSPANCFAAIDYNNYYVGGPTSTLVLGYINSSNQANLTALQSSFGSNLNSKNVLPVFTSSVDLHLAAMSNPILDNSGAAIANVTTDIDGQSRSALTPDIGADEFFSFGCGSVASATQNIIAYNLCNGQSVTLNATSGSGNGIVYQWQFASNPGGPYTNVSSGSGATTTTYTTGSLNTGNYFFVLKTTCTTSSMTSISNESTVTVYPIPTLTLTSNIPVCLGQNLFLNSNSNIGTQFNWAGPNSFNSSIQNATITSVSPANAGIYTLTTSQYSCTNSGTINIILSTPTIAATNAGPYCIGNNMQLNTYTASGYNWTGPLGFTSNLQNPIINSATTNMSGTYTLNANLGGCIATATTIVSINGFPSVPTISYNGPLCAGSNLTLTCNGNSNLYFSWNGPNSFYSYLQNPIITNVPSSAAGTYSLTLSDANNCSSTSTLAVIINPGPQLTITPSSGSVCAGQNVTLIAQGAISYTWSNSSNNSSITITPTVTSTFSVTGTSSNGCTTTIPQLINVNPSPTVFIISSSNTICFGTSATLNASGAINYTWSTGSNNSQITVSPITNTIYTLVGKSLNGCTNSTSQAITIIPLPNISITSSNSLICIGSNAILTANGAVNYTWSTGSYSPQIIVSPTMNQSFTLTGTNNNGCVNSNTYLQNVTICTSLEKNPMSSKIQIYPNPNNGEIYIKFNENYPDKNVEIYNSIGQLVKYIKIEIELQKINISEFANGFYLVIIKNGNSILNTTRLIKD